MQTWVMIAIVVFLLLVLGGGLLAGFSGNGQRSGVGSSSCGNGSTDCVGGADNTPKFVLFYTTWCGFCKMIKPAWERLQSEYPNNVVSIDADSSEARNLKQAFGVNGYPSIHWAPAGLSDPDSAIQYNSARDYESLKNYLESRL